MWAQRVTAASPVLRCTTACSVRGQERWSTSECLALDTDLQFVADDCSVAVALFEVPQRAQEAIQTVVAKVVSAGLTEPIVLGHFMPTFEREGARVRWLAGVALEPGDRPALIPGGVGLRLTTVDGTTHLVHWPDLPALARQPLPSVLAATKAAEQTTATALYRWTDSHGVSHVVMGAENVPPPYAARATRVSDELSVVAGNHDEATPPAPPPSGSAPIDSPPAVDPAPPAADQPDPDQSWGNGHESYFEYTTRVKAAPAGDPSTPKPDEPPPEQP